jgi:hypothetical protein
MINALNQPFTPPVMHFENKSQHPAEAKIMYRAAALAQQPNTTKVQVTKVVEEALLQ